MTTSTRFNIDTCAMLVEFNASVWTARKLDRSTSDEVVRDKGATAKDAARVNKNLLAGRGELETVATLVGSVRQYVYENTLPWSDSGMRLLPSVKFSEFNDRMGEYETQFVDIVNEFVGIYPTLITAQAMALGDMFDRNEYPSAYDIAHKFSFRLNYMPVPTAGDFRVDVGNDAQDALRAQLSKMADERINNAMKDARDRLKTHLDRMMSQLRVETVNGKVSKGKLYDTLIDGGLDLCNLLEALNLTGDQSIEDARRELKRLLDGADIVELRKHDDARTDLREKVSEIMDKFAF